jgi:hypothetical protein
MIPGLARGFFVHCSIPEKIGEGERARAFAAGGGMI